MLEKTNPLFSTFWNVMKFPLALGISTWRWLISSQTWSHKFVWKWFLFSKLSTSHVTKVITSHFVFFYQGLSVVQVSGTCNIWKLKAEKEITHTSPSLNHVFIMNSTHKRSRCWWYELTLSRIIMNFVF